LKTLLVKTKKVDPANEIVPLLESFFNEVVQSEALIRSFWLTKLPTKNESNNHVYNDPNERPNEEALTLKAKMKRYKNEIQRLKDKIHRQNKDIEEALQELSETNKDKENTNQLLKTDNSKLIANQNSAYNYEMDDRTSSDGVAYKLEETHLKLKKARDNIQKKLDEAGIEVDENDANQYSNIVKILNNKNQLNSPNGKKSNN